MGALGPGRLFNAAAILPTRAHAGVLNSDLHRLTNTEAAAAASVTMTAITKATTSGPRRTGVLETQTTVQGHQGHSPSQRGAAAQEERY